MFLNLLLLFTIVPVAELYVLIRVGSAIGALNTILVVIGTAAAGAYLARREGMRALVRIRELLALGQLPGAHMVDALLIFVAGVLLLTPGFITDALGFLLLVPHTRRMARLWLVGRFSDRIARAARSTRVEP